MSHLRPRSISATVLGTAAGLALALAAAPASAPAITPVDPDGRPDVRILDGTAQRELDAARAQWRAAGVRSYRIRVAVGCFCPPEIRRPRTLTVRRGKPVRPVPAHLRVYATVPRLFARIQDAIDDRVAALTADYGAHGLPRKIFVDKSFMIADEELGLTVDRFRRVR